MEFHPAADIFPMMSESEFAGLVEDIRVHDLREPIWLHKDGRLLDGRNRWKACVQLGLTPDHHVYDGDDSDLVSFVVSMNLYRRHLSVSQLAMVQARLETLGHGGNNRRSDQEQDANLHLAISRTQAAELIGGSERSAAYARKVLTSGIPSLSDAVDRNGLPVSIAALIAEKSLEEQEHLLARALDDKARVSRELREEKEARKLVNGAHVGHNDGENEWYTPEDYIKAARAVMGGIDLDPASSAIANDVVEASAYYTAETNGLEQPWRGRVWMNPPYAQPLIGQFCSRLAEEFEAGHVTEACVLVNNATETRWFQQLGRSSSAICFPEARVKFWYPGRTAAPLQGQAVLYLGSQPGVFTEQFSQFGLTVRTEKGISHEQRAAEEVPDLPAPPW